MKTKIVIKGDYPNIRKLYAACYRSNIIEIKETNKRVEFVFRYQKEAIKALALAKKHLKKDKKNYKKSTVVYKRGKMLRYNMAIAVIEIVKKE